MGYRSTRPQRPVNRIPEYHVLMEFLNMIVTLCLVSAIVLGNASEVKGHGTFSYNRDDLENGPYGWQKLDPTYTCNGSIQSPINIWTPRVVYGQKQYQLRFNYQSANERGHLQNNGHAAEFVDTDHDYTLTGVPFHVGDTFVLEQLHFHLGGNDDVGSEHTVNGHAYSGEVHMVHFNKKYGTIGEAIKHTDGLAVAGVFIVAGSPENDVDDVLQNNLPHIREKDDEVDVVLSPIALLPRKSAFYFYKGSLTTPPCSEVVTWMVYKDPIFLTEDTFDLMRSLKTADDSPLGKYGNFRPVHSAEGRPVFANFLIQTDEDDDDDDK